MKKEVVVDEIKDELKKLQEKSSNKTILFIILGIVTVGLITVFAIMKLKGKCGSNAEDDDDEYVFYGDDEDDFYEDYRALD